MTPDDVHRLTKEISKKLTDEGKLIEAGAVIFMAMIAERYKAAPPEQLDDLLYAFMAGAQHLFGSIMGVLDENSEPTDMDMQRMALIDKELAKWADLLRQRYTRTKGNA